MPYLTHQGRVVKSRSFGRAVLAGTVHPAATTLRRHYPSAKAADKPKCNTNSQRLQNPDGAPDDMPVAS